MQIKVFTIPVTDSNGTGEMNAFLSRHRVLEVRSEFVDAGANSFWTCLVTYIEGDRKTSGSRKPRRVDYKEVLSPDTFAVFAKLRDWRREVSKTEGIPAYAVFTDEELAGIARLPEITVQAVQNVPGVGEKKAARYGDGIVAHLGGNSGATS